MLERVTTTTTTVVTTKTEGQYQLEKFGYDPYAKGKAYKTKQVTGFIEQPWYSQLLTSGDIQVRHILSAASGASRRAHFASTFCNANVALRMSLKAVKSWYSQLVTYGTGQALCTCMQPSVHLIKHV